MNRFVKWPTFMICALVVALAGVRLAGAQQMRAGLGGLHEITLPTGGRQACWRGICPGQPIYQAEAFIAAMPGFYAARDLGPSVELGCWENRPVTITVCLMGETVISQISIKFDPNGVGQARTPNVDEQALVRFGDLVQQWGAPSALSFTFCEFSLAYFENGVRTGITWVPTTTDQSGPGAGNGWVFAPDSLPSGEISIGVSAPIEHKDAVWKGFKSLRAAGLCGGD